MAFAPPDNNITQNDMIAVLMSTRKAERILYLTFHQPLLCHSMSYLNYYLETCVLQFYIALLYIHLLCQEYGEFPVSCVAKDILSMAPKETQIFI